MDDHCWLLTSRLRHRISILWHTPLSLMRLCIAGWSLLVVYLTSSTSDIHTRAYSLLLGKIVFGQQYIDGWSLLVVYLTTLTLDIILGHIPLSLMRLCIDGWSLLVVYLMNLTSDLILGHISSFSLSILKIETVASLVLDWVLVWSFRRLTVSGPPLYGFVETEMDRIRFHPRSMGGSFSQMFMRYIFFRHCYLADWIIQMSSILRTLRFTFIWATIYTLWDLPFEIRWHSSFSNTKSSFRLDFSEVCHDASVFDPLISADDWFIGCFNSVSTPDTGAYFPSWVQ